LDGQRFLKLQSKRSDLKQRGSGTATVILTAKAGQILRRLAIATLALYWTTIFVGTHMPADSQGEIDFPDKLVHFLGYTGLGFLLAWAVLWLRPTLTRAIGLLLIVTTYGMADELTQTFVPSRSMEAGDWFADVCGGLTGLACYFLTQGLCRHWPAADRRK
jgi:VanZ family protein